MTPVTTKGDLVVFSEKRLAGSPAIPLILNTYAELIQAGNAAPVLTFTNDSSVIWVEKQGKPVGGIVYEYKPDIMCGWIVLSFTHKNFRKQGINKLCYSVLEKECKELGATHLSSFVSMNNKERVDSMEKVGMKPVVYRTYKKL